MEKRPFPIFTILFFLFCGFTLLELWVLFALTKATSLGFTILLAVFSAVVGAALARRAGLAAFNRVVAEMNAGRIPARSIGEGMIILMGGAMLIAPGLITDIIGFSTLIAPCRSAYLSLAIRMLKPRFKISTQPFGFPGATDQDPPPKEADSDTIDVEYKELD